MLYANGVPVRAVHGGLAGARQSVGRAERLAGLSDLLGFAQEGELWRDGEVGKVTSASVPHPGVWRQLVRLLREPPQFAW
eukprot:8996455-Pyramimonas_sp.AAC.1